jgi:hypothetical protein
MKLRYAIAIVVLISSLTSAQEKKDPKPFAPPEDPVLFNQFVAKDEACVRDYAKSLKMDGLELRKYLAELVTYGCIRKAEGTYLAKILNVKRIGEGKDAIQIRQVRLMLADSPKALDPRERIIEVWVLANQLTTLSALKSQIGGKQLP